MMSEELIAEIKGEIARCEHCIRKAEIAIATANEQKERYAETLSILRYLLSVAEKSTEESEQKGGD